MQAKLQHPDLIETLFTMAGGDAQLLERAVTALRNGLTPRIC